MPKGIKGFQVGHPNYNTEETKRKISETMKKKGIRPPSRKGIKLLGEHKNKISEALKGRKPTVDTLKKMSEVQKGKKLSIEHRRKMSEAHRGSKGNSWRGGITPIRRIVRNSYKYRQWRSDVFTRDDFTCQKCGKRGGDLVAHHINEFFIIMDRNKINDLEQALNCEELWNINNGITLCKKCHLILHSTLKSPRYGAY